MLPRKVFFFYFKTSQTVLEQLASITDTFYVMTFSLLVIICNTYCCIIIIAASLGGIYCLGGIPPISLYETLPVVNRHGQ